VIGAGNVGATTAQRLLEAEIADVVLVDIIEGLPQGKALDMAQAAALLGSDAQIVGTNDFAAIAGSDIVIVTAGLPRKPGMSRDDLLVRNAEIVSSVLDHVLRHAPNCILIVVSNPLDVMTWLAWRKTGFGRQRVMGMAGVLDAARFQYFIAQALSVSAKDVNAMVLGGHGDDMVPLPRFSTVNGVPIPELLSPDQIARLVDRTRNGGAEIVALLKQGSAWYAPSASVAQMTESILRNQRRLLPVCALLEGEYGLKDVFVGVPAIICGKGMERVVELKLTQDEDDALHRSAAHVRESCKKLSL
jgi:malate dehydrogenase